jgi:spoIIIJ-associated protein
MVNTIKDIIEDILRTGGFSYEEVVLHAPEYEEMVWYQIKSNDSKSLIGHNGETLSALNHMVKKVAEKKKGEEEKLIDFFIDVNDYQKKRVDALKTIAHMMAERARFFKSSVDVDPMTAFERKIIHSYLASQPDVATESVGVGPGRHIVIKYVIKEVI